MFLRLKKRNIHHSDTTNEQRKMILSQNRQNIQNGGIFIFTCQNLSAAHECGRGEVERVRKINNQRNVFSTAVKTVNFTSAQRIIVYAYSSTNVLL